MNIRKMVGDIHSTVERGSRGAAHSSTTLYRSPGAGNELALLHGAYKRLYRMRGCIGRMPPAPDTFRARCGALLVRVVQRMLFWYTPQIERVQVELTNTIGSLCRLIEMQEEALNDLTRDIRALQVAPAAERPHGSRPGRSEETGESSIPPAFEFALQDRFRGSERDTMTKLKEWLRLIIDSGGSSGGPWLDIGCGRGEWLAMVSAAGYAVSGIDANAVSVDYCRNLAFDVVHSDAMSHLGTFRDDSLGVISMFQVVEHLGPEYLLQLLPLIFRKLRKGGLIAIETPNPGNLLVGSHYFWNDPTHKRPLPEALLVFTLEWAGFSVVRRAGLNPFPLENHLPWTELHVVRQVDDLLYSSRDYGLLGRK
jgi:SAM-dependent methyltransferase